MFSKHCKRRD